MQFYYNPDHKNNTNLFHNSDTNDIEYGNGNKINALINNIENDNCLLLKNINEDNSNTNVSIQIGKFVAL